MGVASSLMAYAVSVQIKCEMYWPRDLGSSSVHGNLDVTLSAITTLADYSIRTFSLQKVISRGAHVVMMVVIIFVQMAGWQLKGAS